MTTPFARALEAMISRCACSYHRRARTFEILASKAEAELSARLSETVGRLKFGKEPTPIPTRSAISNTEYEAMTTPDPRGRPATHAQRLRGVRGGGHRVAVGYRAARRRGDG